MSIPDDRLFWLALIVLCLGAVYEFLRTSLDLGPHLRAVVRSFRQAALAQPAQPAATPVLVTIPVSASTSPVSLPAPTNYLETMSHEEMDQFLNESGV